jgi:ribosome biogenesis protein BMS1
VRTSAQRAVVLEPGERKLYTLVQQLNTIRNAKVKKRQEQHERRRKAFDKVKSKDVAASAQRMKDERKRRYIKEGQQEARKKARGGGAGDD